MNATPSQICHAVLPGIPFLVVFHESDVLPCLVQQVLTGDAAQVLVTGYASWGLLMELRHQSTNPPGPWSWTWRLHTELKHQSTNPFFGNEWEVLAPSKPDYWHIRPSLEALAEAINDQPAKRRIWFGATGPDELPRFFRQVAVPCAVAMYLVGMTGEAPKRDMLAYNDTGRLWASVQHTDEQLRRQAHRAGPEPISRELPSPSPGSAREGARRSVKTQAILSAEDPDFTISTQEEIRDRLTNGQAVDELVLGALELWEESASWPR